jgi:23S rRNA maturation-related 3'-5' exoribonuclease YhaM
MNDLEIIAEKLNDITKEIFRKYGTDAYEIRCAIYDLRDELKKLSQHDVIKNEVTVCDHKQVDLVRHACKCKNCGKVMETEW